MYKQIILIILLVNQLINAQEKTDKTLVYNKSKIVGFLYSNTKLKNCEGCYVLDSLKIFNKLIVIKSEALVIDIGENEKQFTKLYTVEKIKEGNEFIILLNNTMNSTSHSLYIKKIKGKIFIHKLYSHSNSSAKVKIGKDDYSDYPSNYICIKNLNKKIVNDTLNIDDLFKYNEKMECFHCPTRNTLKECLEIKRTNKKINWN